MEGPKQSPSHPRESTHENPSREEVSGGGRDTPERELATRWNIPWPQQQYLAAIVESSNDAIIGKDLTGIIRSWNHGAEQIFGYRAEEAVGRHISLLTPPNRIDEVGDILRRVSHGEHIHHYRTERKTKEGRILPISLTISPIHAADGSIVGASKIARDISKEVHDESALREAVADLEEFAYAASHDLQEPLRIVSTYGEMVQRKFSSQLGATGDEYMRYIVGAAIQMDQLLTNLRSFVQSSVLFDEPIDGADAGRALRNAIARLQAAIETSGAVISCDSLPQVPMHEFQLEQVFQNLLGNSIRYRSKESPRIHVAAEQVAEIWKFSVKDNGIGIEPQYQEQIFGLFKRLHANTEYPGTGMGLAICKRIVERSGGRIWVESQPGRGSTFFFTVAARPV